MTQAAPLVTRTNADVTEEDAIREIDRLTVEIERALDRMDLRHEETVQKRQQSDRRMADIRRVLDRLEAKI